jgi:hypothetical protein
MEKRGVIEPGVTPPEHSDGKTAEERHREALVNSLGVPAAAYKESASGLVGHTSQRLADAAANALRAAERKQS